MSETMAMSQNQILLEVEGSPNLTITMPTVTIVKATTFSYNEFIWRYGFQFVCLCLLLIIFTAACVYMQCRDSKIATGVMSTFGSNIHDPEKGNANSSHHSAMKATPPKKLGKKKKKAPSKKSKATSNSSNSSSSEDGTPNSTTAHSKGASSGLADVYLSTDLSAKKKS